MYAGDYEPVVRKYDGPQTAFYLDPPYPGYNVAVGESEFDEERFFGVLEAIKGKWLMTYGVRGRLPAMLKDAGFHIKRIRTPRTIGSMRGVGGPSVLTQLLVSNYELVEKVDGDEGPLLEDWDGQLTLGDGLPIDTDLPGDVAKAEWSRAFVNDLPDSAFLYIEPGGRKDEDGKTVPRSLRHFPVRDDQGELDLPHLRNAIARIPQARIPGLTADDLRELQERARQLLAEASEGGGAPFAKSIPLIKDVDPNDERYVLGVVLEPEVVDAQGDIYSADEIRQAAHRFMEEFGGAGCDAPLPGQRPGQGARELPRAHRLPDRGR